MRLDRAIHENPWLAFFALSAAYGFVVAVLSWIKLLWLDELITLHIARLGSVHAIWNALALGGDPNPPMTHLLMMMSRNVFGEHEFALRLPAILGYWIGLLALFAFLKRRVSPNWALAGTVLSMTMGAFEYSYEARSYGIFYGLAMLGVFFWSVAVDGTVSVAARRLCLIGMTITLAAGLCTNYFSVLAFLPICGGEAVRTWQRQQRGHRWLGLDGQVWFGMAIASLPLLAFRPLIQRSISKFAPYAWNKVSLDQVADSYTEMVEIVLFPLLALFVFAGVVMVLGKFCRKCRSRMRPLWLGRLADAQTQTARWSIFPRHESTAAFLLMIYPILGYCIASIRGGMLSPRFVIPVCFGFAIVGVAACVRTFGHIREAAVILLLCCSAWFAARESVVGYQYMEQKQAFYKVIRAMPGGAYTTEPLVIPDPLMALTFQHYAPEAMVRRIVFPLDFPAVRLYRREDSAEENLWVGKGSWYNLPILTLADFQRSAGQYLILASDGNWMVQDLMRHRYPVERLAINTRAGALGGFTPLMHGTPVFFSSVGDRFLHEAKYQIVPIPFKSAKNLPEAKLGPEDGGPPLEKK